MKNFFISYNKADRSWAEWIAWQLEEAGYTTVLQAWDFRPGENFVIKMNQATQEAERTIAVLSPEYISAVYTQSEWGAAFSQDPTGEKGLLLPILVRRSDLKGLLNQVIYIDLVGLNEEDARNVLIPGVQRGRAKPSVEPSFPGSGLHSVKEQPLFPGGRAEEYERGPVGSDGKTLVVNGNTRRKSMLFSALFVFCVVAGMIYILSTQKDRDRKLVNGSIELMESLSEIAIQENPLAEVSQDAIKNWRKKSELLRDTDPFFRDILSKDGLGGELEDKITQWSNEDQRNWSSRLGEVRSVVVQLGVRIRDFLHQSNNEIYKTEISKSRKDLFREVKAAAQIIREARFGGFELIKDGSVRKFRKLAYGKLVIVEGKKVMAAMVQFASVIDLWESRNQQAPPPEFIRDRVNEAYGDLDREIHSELNSAE
jgi:hypothetical protein